MDRQLGSGGVGLSDEVRAPKDEQEALRARLLAHLGEGLTVAEVIEKITGEAPEDEFVRLVTERLRAAVEDGEALDLAAFLAAHASWTEAWA